MHLDLSEEETSGLLNLLAKTGVPTHAAAPSALIGIKPVGTSSVMNL
jgi:hypothetical protein